MLPAWPFAVFFVIAGLAVGYFGISDLVIFAPQVIKQAKARRWEACACASVLTVIGGLSLVSALFLERLAWSIVLA